MEDGDDRRQRVYQVYRAVSNVETVEREAVLDRECGGDGDLRARVESLLAHTATPTSSPTAPPRQPSREPGSREPASIGPYRIISLLGRGGMGAVYLCVREDGPIRRQAAVKVLKRGMDTADILRRFELERQLLAALNHPGIARLFDGGETDEGLPYFALEQVEGLPIDTYCDRHRLRTQERFELFEKVCAAVHYAHQNLVIHRDLKPGNILVTSEGQPKLLDFGIAKLINPGMARVEVEPTSPQMRVMTPEYASPEQVRGEPLTTATDIYSLGVLLYELLTGHRPYRLRSSAPAEIERVVCEVEPQRPSTAVSRAEVIESLDTPSGTTSITPDDVSRVRDGRPDRLRRRLAGDVDTIVLKALRKEPQRRYQSAQQFAEDIRRHLVGEPVIARPDTLHYRVSKFVRRHRVGVAAAALIVLLLVGGITGISWQARVAATQRDAAREQRDRATRHLEQVLGLGHLLLSDFNDAIVKLDGALAARELLINTAMDTFGELSKDVAENPVLTRELACAYDNLGDVRGGIRNPSRADTMGALENYQAALDLRRSLLAMAPQDAQRQREVSDSVMKVGDALVQTGNIARGLEAYQEALRLSESLAEADPNLENRRTVAGRVLNVGAAIKRMGRLDEARRHYERSLRMRQVLADEDPGNPKLQRDLAVGLGRVGEVLDNIGDHEGALEQYLKAIEIRGRLAASDIKSSTYRRDLAVTHSFAAESLLAMDRPSEALEHASAFLATAERGFDGNPGSARHQRDLAVACDAHGRVMLKMGDTAAAMASFQRFASIITPLADADPQNTQYRRAVANSHERIAEALEALGDQQGAIDADRKALAILSELVDAEPQEVRIRENKAIVQSALGSLLAGAGRKDEARRMLLAARAEYEGLRETQPEHASVREGLELTLERFKRLDREPDPRK